MTINTNQVFATSILFFVYFVWILLYLCVLNWPRKSVSGNLWKSNLKIAAEKNTGIASLTATMTTAGKSFWMQNTFHPRSSFYRYPLIAIKNHLSDSIRRHCLRRKQTVRHYRSRNRVNCLLSRAIFRLH